MFNKGSVIDVPIHFSQIFVEFFVRPTLRWILDIPKFQTSFLYQSLLLSTTILNDNCVTKKRPNDK